MMNQTLEDYQNQGLSQNKMRWPFFFLLSEDINTPLHNLLRKRR